MWGMSMDTYSIKSEMEFLKNNLFSTMTCPEILQVSLP